jgi:hypothetical protein
MSYATRPEPITYWHIMWYDMTESKWPTKLWTLDQISSLATIAAFIEVDEQGMPV